MEGDFTEYLLRRVLVAIVTKIIVLCCFVMLERRIVNLELSRYYYSLKRVKVSMKVRKNCSCSIWRRHVRLLRYGRRMGVFNID